MAERGGFATVPKAPSPRKGKPLGVKIPTKKALHTQGLAERGGFEPPHGNYPPAGIRSQSLQPLGYLSIFQS